MKVGSIAVFKKCIHDLFKLKYSKKYMDVIYFKKELKCYCFKYEENNIYITNGLTSMRIFVVFAYPTMIEIRYFRINEFIKMKFKRIKSQLKKYISLFPHLPISLS